MFINPDDPYFNPHDFTPKLRPIRSKTKKEKTMKNNMFPESNQNPFLQIHTTREGERRPIIMMNASHLIATVNFWLVRWPETEVNKAIESFTDSFADETWDPRLSRAMERRTMTDKDRQTLEDAKLRARDDIWPLAMLKAQPYVFVGVVRTDTREGVLRILDDVFGFNGPAHVKGYDEYPLLPSGVAEPDWESGEAVERPDPDDDDPLPF